jgi:hypothetical protein
MGVRRAQGNGTGLAQILIAADRLADAELSHAISPPL